MDSDSSSQPPAPEAAAAHSGSGPRWRLPKLPVLVGVLGIGAAVTAGTWFKQEAGGREDAEIAAIRVEVAALDAEAARYRERFANLQWHASRIRTGASTASADALQAWARERARCFDALVHRIDRTADEQAFSQLSREIEAACERRDVATARQLLHRIPEIRFPSPARFQDLQRELYLKPLATLSRQNPDYYRAFREHEPEAAKEDLATLRGELGAGDLEACTPQSMLKLELYSAVAPPGDPLAEDWAALATAPDFFDDPDPSVLAAWRRARRAERRGEWSVAAAEMQSIARLTIRTRLPFRAAYAWTLLKNRPEDKAAAYPFLQEAAAAGDTAARAWLVDEEISQGRPAQAVRWLEAGVESGDVASIPKLLDLYAKPVEAVPRDLGREAGLLHKIVVTPDAPPLASMLLAQLYATGEGVPASSGNAYAYYRRAAERQHVPAMPAVARCQWRGQGTAVDKDEAVAWACRAFAAGEREQSLPLLLEMMTADPDRVAGPVQELLEHQLVAGPSGFVNLKVYGPSMAQLQTALGRYFDERGKFSQAARFYARSGSRDPAVLARHAALTTAHPCETCHGVGKTTTSTPCPSCGGKGTVVCHVCDGRGYTFVPGTPPCTTCGGSGGMVQEGKRLACGACGGTGKGKGSVVRKDCTVCVQGRETCRACTGGRIRSTKECPDCHGAGVRALAGD